MKRTGSLVIGMAFITSMFLLTSCGEEKINKKCYWLGLMCSETGDGCPLRKASPEDKAKYSKYIFEIKVLKSKLVDHPGYRGLREDGIQKPCQLDTGIERSWKGISEEKEFSFIKWLPPEKCIDSVGDKYLAYFLTKKLPEQPEPIYCDRGFVQESSGVQDLIEHLEKSKAAR